jgi:hypothetical protein
MENRFDPSMPPRIATAGLALVTTTMKQVSANVNDEKD